MIMYILRPYNYTLFTIRYFIIRYFILYFMILKFNFYFNLNIMNNKNLEFLK